MSKQPTKSIHAVYLFFGTNILLALIDAPWWTYLLSLGVLLWWIVRWEGDGTEK